MTTKPKSPKIQKWLKSHLNQEDLSSLEEAVAQAEKKTAGEIVPMVVRHSSTLGHIPIILSLFFIALMFITDALYWSFTFFPLEILAVCFWIVLLYLFVRIFSPMPFIQRYLVNKEDRLLQVERRAEVEFYEAKLHKTQGATGILIFISLMEHGAVILADESIAKKLPPETWQHIIDEMIVEIKKQNLKSALKTAIKKCSDILGEHFPIQEGDTNELSNQLIIRE